MSISCDYKNSSCKSYNQSSTSLTKTWNVAGSYQVKVVVSDMKGQTATLSRTITVTDDDPVTYADWAENLSGLTGPEAAFDADANGDGIANGLAFFLGAENATDDARGLLPTWSALLDEIVMTFRRSDDAAPIVQSAVEYSTTLDAWSTAMDGAPGVTVTVDDDFFEPGVDRVEVRLSKTLAPDGILFLRLKVWE